MYAVFIVETRHSKILTCAGPQVIPFNFWKRQDKIILEYLSMFRNTNCQQSFYNKLISATTTNSVSYNYL